MAFECKLRNCKEGIDLRRGGKNGQEDEKKNRGSLENMLKPFVTPTKPASYDSVAHLGVPHCHKYLIINASKGILTKFQKPFYYPSLIQRNISRNRF